MDAPAGRRASGICRPGEGLTSEATRDRADRLAEQAEVLLNPTTYTSEPMIVGTGGEAATGTIDSCAFVDTLLASPDMVAVDASRHRLGLADRARGLALALDAAATAQVENSLEKMLAHQTAAAHIAAIELQAEALALLGEFKKTDRRYAILSTEAARLMNASGRMMEVTQRGVLTLHRLRTNGRQILIVQHVNVGSGGKAVVAGQLKNRKEDKRTRQGG